MENVKAKESRARRSITGRSKLCTSTTNSTQFIGVLHQKVLFTELEEKNRKQGGNERKGEFMTKESSVGRGCIENLKQTQK